jgi:hypothetical protein
MPQDSSVIALNPEVLPVISEMDELEEERKYIPPKVVIKLNITKEKSFRFLNDLLGEADEFTDPYLEYDFDDHVLIMKEAGRDDLRIPELEIVSTVESIVCLKVGQLNGKHHTLKVASLQELLDKELEIDKEKQLIKLWLGTPPTIVAQCINK